MAFSQVYENFVQHKKMFASEQCRLDTFCDSQIDLPFRHKLALAGFYFIGPDNASKCYFCGVEVNNWMSNDDVILTHLRWSPRCSLMLRCVTDNIPILTGELEQLLPIIHPAITYSNNTRAVVTMTTEDNTDAIMLLSDKTEGFIDKHYISNPVFAAFKTNFSRMKTFEDWPIAIEQKARDLSLAGFFYIGRSDVVRCFSCGIPIQSWEELECVWERHALSSPNCVYLTLMKGILYTKEVTRAALASPNQK